MSLNFRKSGGGFLNGVAGVIVGYQFDAKEWEGKKGKDPYTTLSVQLDIVPDGADKPVQQFLQAGFIYDNQSITDDGLTLESDDDRPIISEDSDAARFLISAIDAGLDETPFSAPEGVRNLEGLVNQRFTFKRVVDEEGTKKFGKRKDKKDPKKEYNRDWLLVSEYHGAVEPAKKGGKKAVGKEATTKTASKANGAAKNADADAQIEAAEGVLLNVLAAAGKPVKRAELSAKIVRYSTENRFSEDADQHNAIRDEYRALIGSVEFLNRQNGWTFDEKAKDQPVSL